MDNKENDPPLADKPKVSSLTDFEIKALKLQKEGREEEAKKEIEAKEAIMRSKAPAEDSIEKPQEVASGEDMRLYENIVKTVNNPIPMDQVPAKYRGQIEEGLATLKSIVEDKELYYSLKKAHDESFKKHEEKVAIKKPVLPPELMPDKKEEKKESGDVPTIKEPEISKPVAVEATKENKKKDNFTFINDLDTQKLDHLKPKESPTAEQNFVPTTNYTPEPGPTQNFSVLDNCPHCGWDLKKSDLTEPSEDDKYDFVQSILGSIRFKKSYKMFEGKYKVTFRSLTSKESDMAFRQIVLDGQVDYQTRALAGTDFYWRNLQAYRMVMSLECITSSEYGTIEVPSIADAVIDGFTGKDLQSKMVPYLNYILDTFLPLESTRSVVGHAYFEFQALCDKLQVMAEAPNFWKAIG